MICQKPLSKKEGVMIDLEKKIYTCSNHVHDGQLLVAVIKDLLYILDENNNFPIIWDTLRPTLLKLGMEKARHYLQENRDYWSGYLAKKDFSNIYGKISYFQKILENNLPSYQYKLPKTHEKENVDDGMTYQTIIPKRKKRRSLNEILGG